MYKFTYVLETPATFNLWEDEWRCMLQVFLKCQHTSSRLHGITITKGTNLQTWNNMLENLSKFSTKLLSEVLSYIQENLIV
jgi:hypothetical protein